MFIESLHIKSYLSDGTEERNVIQLMQLHSGDFSHLRLWTSIGRFKIMQNDGQKVGSCVKLVDESADVLTISY